MPSNKDEEQEATVTEAYLYDLAHSKGNWDMFINELRAYVEQYGIDSRIESLEKVNTIRRGETVSNDVIARHVIEEINELTTLRDTQGRK